MPATTPLNAAAWASDGALPVIDHPAGATPHATAHMNAHAHANEMDGIIHILTCGSVDDGKSTLIGRLLWDAATLPDDTRAAILDAAGPNGEPDLSHLLDGLLAEREQGITIDIAWRYFDTASRRHVIIDSPGHEQYTRNMASGASHADIAIMLVDARHGIKRQTRRHAAILNLVGLAHVVLAVNKMDLVGWSEDAFRAIERQFAELARQFDFHTAAAIPLAARPGDNVVHRSARMPWYVGPTLMERLDRAPGRGQNRSSGLRLPVQTVLRGQPDFRGLAGTVSSGELRTGDPITDAASGRQAHVRRILTMDGERHHARAGDAIVLELDRDLDISRGALLADPQTTPRLARQLTARIVWLADAPLQENAGLLVRLATDLVPVTSIDITAHLDLDTMRLVSADRCAAGDIAVARISLAQPTPADLFADNRDTGSFVLVDALTGATVAGGVITALSDDRDGAQRTFILTREMLARGLCQGLEPGSSEFNRRASEVAILLRAAGARVEISHGPD